MASTCERVNLTDQFMWGVMLGFGAVNYNPLAVLSSPSCWQLISIAQRNQTNIRVDSSLYAKGVVTLGHWVANIHMDTDATWSNKCAHSHTKSQCLLLILGTERLNNSYNTFKPLKIKTLYYVQAEQIIGDKNLNHLRQGFVKHSGNCVRQTGL